MTYTGSVYRPPFEANSLLLEVTVGCSHNKCAFCTMYRGVPFQISPMEQIERDLLEARRRYRHVKRIFLVNADPFVLDANRLKEIATKINTTFPEIETIACYASIKNIQTKTDEQLKELRALKINELNIGVESGMDSVLRHLNKGYTLEDARTQFNRLNQAGMDFSTNIILGAAGMEQSLENAIANSKLLNEVKPYLIFVATLHIDPGSVIYDEKNAGQFIENTLGMNITEELELLRHLRLENSIFFGLHTSNVIPVLGTLPKDQESLIQALEKGMAQLSVNTLNSRPKTGKEGLVLH